MDGAVPVHATDLALAYLILVCQGMDGVLGADDGGAWHDFSAVEVKMKKQGTIESYDSSVICTILNDLKDKYLLLDRKKGKRLRQGLEMLCQEIFEEALPWSDIGKARKRLGWSQGKTAAILGVSVKTYQRCESGSLDRVSYRMIGRIIADIKDLADQVDLVTQRDPVRSE